MSELRLIETGGKAAVVGSAPGRAKVRRPRRTKAERDAARDAKQALEADARIDADLSRTVDAIAFLSRNEPLIARISPMEAEAVSANLKKANHDGEPDMFADYTGVHQFIGIEIERDGQRLIEWKPIGKVTLRELATWLDSDRKTSTTRRQRNAGMAKMLRDLSKVAKGAKDATVEAAMALRRAQGGK